MYICDIVMVVSELADKNPSEDGLFWPKHVKYDRLKKPTVSVTLDDVIKRRIITSVTDQNEQGYI
jgi:hypothetical protein